MGASAELESLAGQDFVLLTTFRRNGAPVPTPVWVAELDGALVVSTPEGTGKLKRLCREARVTLQACSRRGQPLPGAPVISAQAQVSRDPDMVRRVGEALGRKYRWQWKVALVMERLVRRGSKAPRPALIITP